MAIPHPVPNKKFWEWPTPVAYRAVSFAWNASPRGQERLHHAGTDVTCPVGTRLCALTAGTVYYVAYLPENAGWVVQVRLHGQDRTWNLQHCCLIHVKAGDVVTKGQLVASSGQTGNASSPLVHIGASTTLDMGSYEDNSMTFDVMKYCLA